MANRQIRSPGDLAKFEATGRVSTDVPSFSVNTGQAWEALANVAGTLSSSLGKWADEARQSEGLLAGTAYVQGLNGQNSGVAYLRQQAVQNEAAGMTPTGPAIEQTKALLRSAEGFRTKPYWDTNAFRIGYGSDTTTLADGTVVKVTKGMTITQADAERDLDHRLTNVEGKRVRGQLGAAWDRLPPNAQAALYSVGYNYGSLPKAVVAAAKTGDLQQLSSAVASLPANSSRRRKEAALILAKSADPAAADKAPSTTPAAEDQQPVLSTTPLALRNDGTIYGDAFDASAMRSYSWRMQAGLSGDLASAYDQHKDDAASFNGAAAEIRDKYLKDPNLGDPRMREIFDQAFAEKSQGYFHDVAVRHESQLRQEETASFADAFSGQSVELERQAMALGASKDGDTVMQRQLAVVTGNVDAAVKAGTISPAAGLKLKDEVAKTAVRGRFQGVFDALQTPDEKQAFALSILEDWKAGKGVAAKLPYDDVRGLSDTFYSNASKLTEQQKSDLATARETMRTAIADDVASIENSGQGLADLDPKQAEQLLTPTELAKWKSDRADALQTFQATVGLDKQTPADMAARLDMLEPKPGEAGFATKQKIYEAVKRKSEQVLTDRREDPLASANAAGVMKIDPIDPTSPDALTTSLQKRSSQARVLSGLYQMDVPLFTKGEVTQLKAGIGSTDPAKYQGVMSQLDYLANYSGIKAVNDQFGDATADAVQDWQSKVKYFTPDEAKDWLKQKADPAWQERMKPLASKGRTEAAKIPFADIAKGVDQNWVFSPDSPPDDMTKRAITTDFSQLMSDRYAATGDVATAKQQALDRMKTIWGATDLLGGTGGRLMAYPPDRYYPAIAGGHDWMKNDLDAIAKDRGVETGSLSLISDVKTRQAIDGKKYPGYLVSVANPDGTSDVLHDEKGRPLRLFFDYQTATQDAMHKAEEARRTRNDPWMVLGPNFGIGPYYGLGGADEKDLEMNRQRTKEIYRQQQDDMRARREKLKNSQSELDRLGVPKEPF